jgi:AcrR family transcriptional regulator
MSIRLKARKSSSARQKTARIKPRRRRTPDEAKKEALGAARQLLISKGPNAITLQNVATKIGMTHSNLLHHFGSAAELQTALMAMMVRDLTKTLADAADQLQGDQAGTRVLVDTVFDAFDRGGAGQLAAWIALSGNLPHFDAIENALDDLVQAMNQRFPDRNAPPGADFTSAVLLVSLMAFGDAVIGKPLKKMLGRDPAAPRAMVSFLLSMFLKPESAEKQSA